jgi:hypothetical protein
MVDSSRRHTSPPAVSLVAMRAIPYIGSAAMTDRVRTKNASAVCTAMELYGFTSYSALTP